MDGLELKCSDQAEVHALQVLGAQPGADEPMALPGGYYDSVQSVLGRFLRPEQFRRWGRAQTHTPRGRATGDAALRGGVPGADQ